MFEERCYSKCYYDSEPVVIRNLSSHGYHVTQKTFKRGFYSNVISCLNGPNDPSKHLKRVILKSTSKLKMPKMPIAGGFQGLKSDKQTCREHSHSQILNLGIFRGPNLTKGRSRLVKNAFPTFFLQIFCQIWNFGGILGRIALANQNFVPAKIG